MGLILPQTIVVKWSSMIKPHLIEKGYLYTKYLDDVEVNVLDLPNGCNQLVKATCDYCGKPIDISYSQYYKTSVHPFCNKITCHECRGKKTQELQIHRIDSEDNGIIPLYRDKDWLYHEYIENNRTAKNISEQCHVHIRRIEKYIKQFDIHKAINPREKLPKNKLYNLYIVQKLTLEMISSDFKIDVTTISDLLDEYDIPKRSREESMHIYYYERGGVELKRITNKEVWQREGYKESQKKIFKIASNKLENRIKQSASMQKISIEEWNGFITPKNIRIRNSIKYKEWVHKVYERDNYTCQCCGNRSYKGNPVTLNAHHIEKFSDNPDLRFDVDNGITLCDKCHSPKFEGSFHNIYGTIKNTKEQFIKYMDEHGKKKKER